MRLGQGRYYDFDVNDPDLLLNDYKDWPVVKDEAIEIDRSRVARRRNSIGFYFYAVARSSDGQLLCFFGAQGLQTRQGPETMASPGAAGGYMSLRHCGDGRITEESLVADMTAILDNISMR